MDNRFLEKVNPQAGPPAVQRLLIGGGLVVVGLLALTQTTRYLPFWRWQSFWPLGLVIAGVLLIGYGGRNMLIAGLALTALGGLFLIGTLWSILWWAAAVLWPFALIFAGAAILAAWWGESRRGSGAL
jgi:hypothetical protein